MSTAWTLNIVGLAFSTVAAVLMYYFPPRITYFTEKGEPYVQWTGKASDECKSLGVWQVRMSKTSTILLALGFFFQMLGAIIPIWCKSG